MSSKQIHKHTHCRTIQVSAKAYVASSPQVSHRQTFRKCAWAVSHHRSWKTPAGWASTGPGWSHQADASLSDLASERRRRGETRWKWGGGRKQVQVGNGSYVLRLRRRYGLYFARFWESDLFWGERSPCKNSPPGVLFRLSVFDLCHLIHVCRFFFNVCFFDQYVVACYPQPLITFDPNLTTYVWVTATLFDGEVSPLASRPRPRLPMKSNLWSQFSPD